MHVYGACTTCKNKKKNKISNEPLHWNTLKTVCVFQDYMKREYKEHISKNLTHDLNSVFKHFSISSSQTLIDPSINEPFSELTTAFFQADQPHVKLILSSHGTCHTAQYEPALPRQNNINQMNWSHQRELYSWMYGAAKGKHMVGFGSLMVSRSVLPPLTLF